MATERITLRLTVSKDPMTVVTNVTIDLIQIGGHLSTLDQGTGMAI
jgi:hypothetical protein